MAYTKKHSKQSKPARSGTSARAQKISSATLSLGHGKLVSKTGYTQKKTFGWGLKWKNCTKQLTASQNVSIQGKKHLGKGSQTTESWSQEAEASIGAQDAARIIPQAAKAKHVDMSQAKLFSNLGRSYRMQVAPEMP